MHCGTARFHPCASKDAAGSLLRLRHRRALTPFSLPSSPTSTLSSSSSSTSSSSSSSSSSTADKSDAYSSEMSAKMGAVLTYRHEDGINWSSPPLLRGNFFSDDNDDGDDGGSSKGQCRRRRKRRKQRRHGTVLVGSCPQSPSDVLRLAREAGVTHILQLQQGADLAYFGIDGDAVRAAAAAEGIEHLRVPVVDFDPASLRERLPDAVAVLDRALRSPVIGGGGEDGQSGKREPVVYVHCTAGLGRAPAVALAHACWCRDYDDDDDNDDDDESGDDEKIDESDENKSKAPSLEELYGDLATVRPCAPKLDAIKEAAADLVLGGAGGDGNGSAAVPVTIGFRRGALELCLPPSSSSSSKHPPPPPVLAKVAGLDAGWVARLEPTVDRSTGRATLTRRLRPGRHYWKLVWEFDADADGGGDADGDDIEGDKQQEQQRRHSVWATSPHHPTFVDASGNENNVVEVPRESGPPTVEGILAERRLLPPPPPSTRQQQNSSPSAKPWRLSREDKRALRAALAAREARAMNEAEDPREAGLLTWLIRDIKARVLVPLLSSRRR